MYFGSKDIVEFNGRGSSPVEQLLENFKDSLAAWLMSHLINF